MSVMNPNAGKLPLALVGAGGVTVCLFYLMQSLIIQEFSMPATNPVKVADLVLPELTLEVVRESPRPTLIEDAPEIELLTSLELDDPIGAGQGIIFEKAELAPLDTDVISYSTEGDAMVLKQVNPVYPNSALNRGIEGFVLLEFDIDPAGLVQNPRVVYSEPEGVFDRAALNAIERWRFAPKVENGTQVAQLDERRRMSFTIEN